MKICLYFQTITKAGGAEKKICELSCYLIKAGYEVHLITLDQTKNQSFYEISDKVNWHIISLPFKSNSILYKLAKILIVRKIFVSHSIDTLIGFVMSGDKTMYLAALFSKVRIILAERNSPIMYSYLFNKATQLQIWLWMHFADKIVIQNKIYKKLYPISLQKKIVVISNPVPLPKDFSSPETYGANKRFSILSVQRLDFFQKRPDLIVKAFALISQKVKLWDLYLVGNGSSSELNKIHSTINFYQLKDRVKVITAVKNIDKYYLNSHLFVTASLWEGFPNALAEAMSFGLPSVGFGQIDGISDFIGEAGWLTESKHSHYEFAEVMLDAIESPNERKRRGDLARQKISIYSKGDQLQEWNNLLLHEGQS
jgi:glycosyltransferase involved in cell wall biosynthesis